LTELDQKSNQTTFWWDKMIKILGQRVHVVELEGEIGDFLSFFIKLWKNCKNFSKNFPYATI